MRKGTPRFYASLLILVLSLALFVRNAQDFRIGAKVPQDFRVYLRAVDRVDSGQDPYVQSDDLPYKYSPGALAALRLLPREEVKAWIVFKFLCLGLLAVALLRGSSFRRYQEVGFLLLGFLLSWKGLIETLDYGQFEFLVLSIALLAGSLSENRPELAGLLLGLLPWFKLPWGFLLIPFSVRAFSVKRAQGVRFLLGFGTGILALGALAPVLVFGIHRSFTLTLSWLDLLAHQPEELYLGDMNQSLWFSSKRWIGLNPTVGYPLALISGVICGWIFYRLIRRSRSKKFEAPLSFVTPWLILMQLLNPLSWRWGSMLLIGAPFAAANPLKPGGLIQKWLLLGGVILFLIQLNPIAAQLGLKHWTEIHRLGSITTYWLFILMLCVSPRNEN